MQPFVTVIIPTYNRAHCIGLAVRCAQRQIGVDLEIIVVDDASTDDTPQVLSRIQSRDPRIRVIRHEKNKGVSAARNTGIKAAESDFIAFLDSDDSWDYIKLRGQYEWLMNSGKDPENTFCYSYFIYERPNGISGVLGAFVENDKRNSVGEFANIKRYNENEIEDALLMFKLWASPSALFAHHKAIQANGYFNESMTYGEDNEYVFRQICSGGNVTIIPKFLMVYNRPDAAKVYSGEAHYFQLMARQYTCEIVRRLGEEGGNEFLRKLMGWRQELGVLQKKTWADAAVDLLSTSETAPCRTGTHCSLSGKVCRPVTKLELLLA